MAPVSSSRGLGCQVNSEKDWQVAPRKDEDLTKRFLSAIVFYVALLSAVAVSGSGVLKAISYTVPFFIFVVMAWQASIVQRKDKVVLGFWVALALYYYGMFGSLLYNINSVDWPLVIKLLMAPAFVLFGVAFEAARNRITWNQKETKGLFFTLLALPAAVWVYQLIAGIVTLKSTGAVSIFANRNNAALYVITLIGFLNVIRVKPIKSWIVFFVAGVSFATNGVLLATLLAVAFSVARIGPLIAYAVCGGTAIGVLYYFPIDFSVLSRIGPVIDSIVMLIDGRIDVATVSYGELVQKLKTTDLSFMFRLKHWFNLLSEYAQGTVFDWVFGFGIGSFVRISEAGLVPHNDYLRFLFECGLVAFVGFCSLVFLIIKYCGRRWELVPLLTVALYFFSENLVDNFIAMAIFYFVGGAIAFRVRSGFAEAR